MMSKWFFLSILFSLSPLLLCSPAVVHADWGPEQQVTHWGGSVFSKDAASSGDTIHVMFTAAWVDSTGHEEVLYTRSTDAGNSWSPEFMFTNRGANSPRVAVKGSTVHAIWTDARLGQWDAFYRRSTDGGMTWGLETRFSFNGEPGGAGDIVTDDGAEVYAFWGSTRGIHLRKSTDQGASWSRDTIITPNSGLMDAAWCSGVLAIVWEDTRYTTVEVFSKQSSDRGGTWSPDTLLSTRDTYPSHMSYLAADSVGNFFATWMDFKYSPYSMTGDIFMRVSRDSGASWLPEDTVMFSHRGVRSSVLPWCGYLHIVYEDVRDRPGTMDSELYGRYSTDQGLSFGSETRLTFSLPRSSGSILVGTRNRVHLLWSESKVADSLSELYHRWWEPGVGVEEIRGVDIQKQTFKLKISPNPAFQECLITVGPFIPDDGLFRIYDILGREVRRFEVKNQARIRWDLADDKGKKVRSGIYFIQAGAGMIGSETIRATVLRSHR